jgi:hypothetical protein
MAAKHHFYELLNRGELKASGTTPEKFFTLPNSGGCMLAYGTTVPSDATAGYAVGALFIHTDGGATTALYRNVGSATSCNFDEISAFSSLTADSISLGTNNVSLSTNLVAYTNVATTANPQMSFRSATTNAASPYGWVPAFKVGTVQHYVISCTQPNP